MVDKITDMDAMRKQFLKDNWERHDDDNYEFKRRDKDDKVPSTEEINDQLKEKRQKTKWPSYSWLWTSYFKSCCETLMFRNYLGLVG